MKIKTDQRIQSLNVKVGSCDAGLLNKMAQFDFSYHADASMPVSITMPVEKRFFRYGALHPVFEMNLPEGFIRYRITEKLRKHLPVDEMLFLALQGSNGIGRLSYDTPDVEHEELPGEVLAEILGWQGNESLFSELLEKYLLSTGIGGVQPKVIVPEKSSLVLPALIVKTGDEEFPDLATNEYICMKLAKACGIDTPEFWLSDNQQLFVMRRFDLSENGESLAMEDMAVLQGKSTDDRYRSSYEQVAKAISLYSTEPVADMLAFYKTFVLSCMLGNGDAHLKNFSMIYTDESDVRLSPSYDIVNTLLYNPADTLALRLGKSREFPGRNRIERFGKTMDIQHCSLLIENMADQVRTEIDNLDGYCEKIFKGMKPSLLSSLHRATTRTPLKVRPGRRYSKYP
ncbi:hypothetical protein MNBD_GAMMA10-286 [hydrothermal vent metagenome]|uniref:Toxin HigB / Protein kinase domain of HipA n=1 Tax=hydrothermal vent metagenome TaxID=652676 RepID=A0A3B0XGY1_9ZZZZ